MIYLFLADGFEIIEAMAPVDMIRRAKLDIKTVGVTGKVVKSSCGINVEADISIDLFSNDDVDAIILPGGLQGTLNLEGNSVVQNAIDMAVESNKLVCAICAAPSILGHKGLLRGREATVFPGFEDSLNGSTLSNKYVVKSGNFITARGAGVATEFGLEIIKAISGEEVSEKIRKTIQCR